MAKICIDAGHAGKYNPYIVNGKTIGYESEVVWRLHEKLAAELRDAGVEVIVTRTSQTVDPDLVIRGRMAQGCDLFLSLHTNGGSATADYPLAVCSVDGSADAIGLKLAKAVEDAMDTRQTGRVWKRDYQTGASVIVDSVDDVNFGKRAYATNYYGVIRGAAAVGVPGVLLENSFHTNPAMAQWLIVDSNLDKLAKALSDTIVEHYGVKKPVAPVEPEEDWQKMYNELKIAYDSLVSDLQELVERYSRD